MEMKEVYSNDRYKVLSVTLNIGEAMPMHHATSDAFIIGKKGKGKISFADRQVTIAQGDTLLIKANEPHQMEIIEDFSSCIILDHDGRINFDHAMIL
jgi:quercetin dioxygenase-like cupin family protein